MTKEGAVATRADGGFKYASITLTLSDLLELIMICTPPSYVQ